MQVGLVYGFAGLAKLRGDWLLRAQPLRTWLAAHAGAARIVLGTRMAVFASMPALGLIVVDEEHDPSYKQQEGARYSARDLAVYRAQQEGAKVLLGSATPSLESWHHSRPAAEGGRYQRLLMPTRVGAAAAAGLPRVRRVDMNRQPRGSVFSAPLSAALRERVARGEKAEQFLGKTITQPWDVKFEGVQETGGVREIRCRATEARQRPSARGFS